MYNTKSNLSFKDMWIAISSEALMHSDILSKYKLELRGQQYYIEKLSKIEQYLKEKMKKKGKSAEQVIKEYINSLATLSNDYSILGSFSQLILQNSVANCAGRAFTFLTLAEDLDYYNLFKESNIGVLPKHIMIIKSTGNKNEYIDFKGHAPKIKEMGAEYYKERWFTLPILRQKRYFSSYLLTNAGVVCEDVGEAIENQNKKIAEMWYNKAQSLYDTALKIDQNNISASISKAKHFNRIGEYDKALDYLKMAGLAEVKAQNGNSSISPIWKIVSEGRGRRGTQETVKNILHEIWEYNDRVINWKPNGRTI